LMALVEVVTAGAVVVVAVGIKPNLIGIGNRSSPTASRILV
jgi:hypothetical protein